MYLTLAKEERTIGATLLVTGSCIGAGMIGLPVVSAIAGLVPSTVAMFACYLFTTAIGLLLLEAALWFKNGEGLLSITEFTLGKSGKWIACALFLFLFYSLLIAYLDGGGQLFSLFLGDILHLPISREVGIVSCALFFGAIVYTGTQSVDRLNRGLMIGLITSYLILISIGLSQVNLDHLTYSNWNASLGTLPILLVCFGYQNLIPSLTTYLKRNVQALRFAIIVGNFIPFLIYFIWNLVVLGLLPLPTSETFRSITDGNEMVTGLLVQGSSETSVIAFVQLFSLMAIATSFLPTAISFVDFFRDGFKLSNPYRTTENITLHLLVLVPPTICTLLFPHLFLKALGFAGGFADVLLFAMIPSLIVFNGRYIKGIQGPYTVKGGKGLIATIIVTSLVLLFLKN